VFRFDWLVVLIDPSKKQITEIVNDPEHLSRFYEENKHDIWVGFNSRHYDQYILKGILLGFDPKKINDWIIVKGKDGWQYSSLLRNIRLNNYDVMGNVDRGLKWFEGSMGSMIKESSVDFNTPRKLTEAEIQETLKYCRHDVEETIKVFLKRIDDFNAHMGLVKLACEG
jgi:DNA polymerase